MKRLKKKFKEKQRKLQEKRENEIRSYSEFWEEYENLYGSIWRSQANGSFSIKRFRQRMKQIIKLKAFL